MKQHKLYSIFTYLLLLPALVLAFCGIIILFAALLGGAFQMLLPAFMMACVVIYNITTTIFTQKVLVQQKQGSKKLKDWIKVNAYVTIFFAIYNAGVAATFLGNPAELQKASALVAQQQNAAFAQSGLTVDVIITVFKIIVYTLGVYGLLLLIHVFMSFRLLKQYEEKFIEK